LSGGKSCGKLPSGVAPAEEKLLLFRSTHEADELDGWNDDEDDD
jgi:hypothetical protein